jgi:hypothetical protein
MNPEKPKKALKIVYIDAVQWVCPFCDKHNGVPEVDVCACGAARVDEIASR